MYEKQFHREIECLIKVKHKNVVRFVGYCANSQGKAGSYNGKFVMADVQQRLLCFEYLPHGTLDKYITDASCGLDWRTRYKIINGICDGLHYLHQNRIVHMDLKPPNILLDDNMSPKIADFGLSRCFDEMQSRAITSKIGGTMGYLAPEFGSREITYLFDLYSLGVIIMEILTGKKGYEAIEDVLESWSNMLEKSHKDMQLEQIRTESCNDGLDNQYINNEGLAEELEKLFERLRIPHEVRDKRAELEKLKITFVRGALEFFRNYFSRLVDSMLNDKSYLYQQRKLKRPDHASLRNKCTTYAHVLQHLKSLDRSCLGPLGKAYCHSLNLLLRQEAREFSIVLRESMKAPNNPSFWLEESNNASQNGSTIDTSTVSDAYSKILTTFIPLLMEEISFFSQFMSFEVPTPFPANDQEDDDLNLLDFDGNDSKEGNTCVKLGMNEALQELLHGIQEDFYVVVDWAYKIDPLCSISMHGITICYLSSQKANAAGFVCKLLDDLQSRISLQFSRFIYEAWHQIKHNERNAHQNGILAYIPRFVVLASRMEQYVQGQSRDLIDKAYTKLFYNRASESYEQACTRHISSLIFLQFERLFQFSREVDELTYTVPAEECPR